MLPALHALGLPALVISYRNDPEAPASPDGRYHLGDTEWLDLEAAMDARGRGGRAPVRPRRLVDGRGHHRGAAVALGAGGPGGGLVWDAPLVDWRATLRQQARIRHLPPALTEVTTRVAGAADRHRLRPVRPARPPACRPATHAGRSTRRATARCPRAQPRLAAAAPELGWPMTYLEVPDAEHTAAWNADPAAYEDAVTRFLARWVT